MEPASPSGIGDTSLNRYLDGEFWSLKKELHRLLGGCPLFRHRYRAPPPAVWPRPLGHRAPLGSPPGTLWARSRRHPPTLCR